MAHTGPDSKRYFGGCPGAKGGAEAAGSRAGCVILEA
jgi:hypothetical protein